jgi:hemolysin III
MLFDLREPVSALSHGAGMLLAMPLTLLLWRQCLEQREKRFVDSSKAEVSCVLPLDRQSVSGLYERGKRLSLLIFGISLIICYGSSALYHGAWLSGEALNRLRRLDHVGIFLLIAGTYTPGTWALMSGNWRRGTLACVWSAAVLCSARVWLGGVLPVWMSTAIYLAMGWGVLFCYRELARNHGHRRLFPLPLGGIFYSVGAAINLECWPVLSPGVFGSHELFHFFVLAGTACHVYFMLRVVIPAEPPAGWDVNWPRVQLGRGMGLAPGAN